MGKVFQQTIRNRYYACLILVWTFIGSEGDEECLFENMTPGRHSVGATLISEVNNRTVCQEMCARNPLCVAYQTTNAAGTISCWNQNMQSALSGQMLVDNTTDEYVKQPGGCPTSELKGQLNVSSIGQLNVSPVTVAAKVTGLACAPRWRWVGRRQSINAAHYLGANTLDDCFSYCASVPECVAVDFDLTKTDNAGCWTHSRASYLLGNNTYRSSYPVDQYIIHRKCLTYDTETTLAPELKGQLNVSSTDQLNVSTMTVAAEVTGHACAPRWMRYESRLSQKADHSYHAKKLDDCFTICAKVPECVAVDFGSTKTENDVCWFHRSASHLLPDNTYATSDPINQYIIDRACPKVSTLAPGCITQWSQENDTRSQASSRYFHYYQDMYNTVPACQQLCLILPECVAIDFHTDFSTLYGGCYVHKTADDIENKYSAPGIIQYTIIGANCGTATGSEETQQFAPSTKASADMDKVQKTTEVLTGQLDVSPTGQLDVSPTGQLDVSPTGQLNMSPTGQLNVSTTGQLNVSTTGQLNVSPIGQLNASPMKVAAEFTVLTGERNVSEMTVAAEVTGTCTSATNGTTKQREESKPWSLLVIILIVVVVFCCIVACVCFTFCVLAKKRQNKDDGKAPKTSQDAEKEKLINVTTAPNGLKKTKSKVSTSKHAPTASKTNPQKKTPATAVNLTPGENVRAGQPTTNHVK